MLRGLSSGCCASMAKKEVSKVKSKIVIEVESKDKIMAKFETGEKDNPLADMDMAKDIQHHWH